jgi:hypothetical protein
MKATRKNASATLGECDVHRAHRFVLATAARASDTRRRQRKVRTRTTERTVRHRHRRFVTHCTECSNQARVNAEVLHFPPILVSNKSAAIPSTRSGHLSHHRAEESSSTAFRCRERVTTRLKHFANDRRKRFTVPCEHNVANARATEFDGRVKLAARLRGSTRRANTDRNHTITRGGSHRRLAIARHEFAELLTDCALTESNRVQGSRQHNARRITKLRRNGAVKHRPHLVWRPR